MNNLNFRQSLADRVLKFDTLHAVYMIACGAYGLFCLFFHLQLTWNVITGLVFAYALLDGIRRLVHNPYKQAAKLAARRQRYLHLYEEKPCPPGSTKTS